ncbi:MAG TPA: NUDIX domain-containing protein [Actinomycetota bacterium]|jgi:8-oxo-dGTP pyrophosphatase MutT (NUDIX family)
MVDESSSARESGTAGTSPAEAIHDRPTARIVLIAPDDRVLLFHWFEPSEGIHVWFTPGGGVQPGETYEDAARRELREETGVEAELGPWIWTREHLLTLRGVTERLLERFFVVHAPSNAVDTSGFDEFEASAISGHRWLSVREIAAWPDLVAPRRLADLLPPILRGEYPDPPIDAGV